MVKLILVSATALEIEPVIQFLEPHKSSREHNFIFENLDIKICVTGVGMVNTAFELGKLDGSMFDVAINVGIAGSFSNFETGQVVNVIEDCFSELGAEDGANFLRIDELGFGKQKLEVQNPLHSDNTNKLPKVRGITVNTVHGNETSIKNIIALHKPDVESMEGAAFIHAANAFGWKAVQLRSISNKVERRDKEKWDVPLAIKNLNEIIIKLLKELNAG